MLKFTKMEGLGNDYIYFNCIKKEISNPSELAVKLSDRHFGIGGDGIVLILPSEVADFRMRMFNADGSEAEMCGNAIRCVGKYLYDRGLTKKQEVLIETKLETKFLNLILKNGIVEKIKVDMGEPILEGSKIPVNSDKPQVIDEYLLIHDEPFKVNCISMGNPHCVIFVDKITDNLVLYQGPLIERHDFFPNRVNVEFAKVLNRSEIEMRVWERGSGETLACGTGACAAAVAAVLNKLTDRKVVVRLLGGDLEIEFAKNNHVFKTGPANFVFDGEIETD